MKLSTTPTLALAIPCYNEEATLNNTIDVLQNYLQQLVAKGVIASNSYALFIDDGSKDATWSIIRSHANTPIIKGIKLSNNCGHQKALLAGLHYCKGNCDCCISLDADLQDDINVIEQMIAAFNRGNNIVYGVRADRSVDSSFKKQTAEWYYRILKLMRIDIVFNHADFRLVDSKVLHELFKYKESHIFLRGIFPLMGFKYEVVHYQRKDRAHGETKYPFTKMFRLALDGITSFSGFPLRIITITGFIIFIGCILAMLWIVFVLIAGRNVPGWASITLPIYFLGGIQLLALGVIGTYINKIFEEVKKRPLYHIEETI